MKKTIYIDVTDAILNNLNTGIQRVVRNIASRSELIEKISGCSVTAIIIKNNRLFRTDIEKMFMTPGFLQEVKGFFVRTEAAFKRFFPGTGLTWSFVRNLLKKAYVKMNFAGTHKNVAGTQEVFPGEGDAIFFPDVFWTSFYDINKVISVWKKRGVRIAVLVHDIIPLRYPGGCDAKFTAAFKEKFEEIAGSADFIFTISDSEKKNIDCYCKEQDLKCPPVEYFYPGADFGDFKRIGGTAGNISKVIRKRFPDIFGSEILILMVGTIISTKNHVFVVKAFEKLIASGLKANLAFVGKHDSAPSEIISKIKGSSCFGKSLFLLGTVSDEELEFIYESADALVIASEAEGFGLPLIEAAVKDIPVVASDIPVFREIGEKLRNIYYFKTGDESSFVSAVIKATANKGKKRSETPPATANTEKDIRCWIEWDESVEILSKKLARFAECPFSFGDTEQPEA